MNNMQQIIVYRNPLEAALWNGQYGAYVFPVICGVVVFLVAFLLLNKIMNFSFIYHYVAIAVDFVYNKLKIRSYTFNKVENAINWVSLALAFTVMITVMYRMII
jgi:hypothetical protein